MLPIVKKVGALLWNSNNEVLIFLEKNHQGELKYNIPKGTYDPNLDDTLSATLYREIKEETGLEISAPFTALDIFPKYYDDHISLLILFETTIERYEHATNQHTMRDEHISDYRWVSQESFLRMPVWVFMDVRMYTILQKYLNNRTWNA